VDCVKTAPTPMSTSESYEGVRAQVMTTLKRSFHGAAIASARGTKLRREGRALAQRTSCYYEISADLLARDQ